MTLPFPSTNSPDQAMALPKWYPHFRGRPIFRGNPEALAWALDTSSTILTFVGSGAFLGRALLKLATYAAGCQVEPLEEGGIVEPCDRTVYGIRPSSLLTTVSTIVGVASAALMPLMGAIVDYTPHRRVVGRCIVIIFWSVLFVGIFVSERTWFPIAILQILMGFTAWFQATVTYSYLPELTDDKEIMNEYTRTFAILSFIAMIVYLGGINGATVARGLTNEGANKDTLRDEILTARIAQITSCTVSAIGLGIAWGFLLQKRPALRELPGGQSLWTAGFRQLGRTIKNIIRDFPQLKWFYVAISFCDAAIMAITILAITYFTDQLSFTAAETGVALMLMLVASIPGSAISSWLTSRFSAVVSSICAVIFLLVITTAVTIVLSGPDKQVEGYILASGWGLGTGWKFTSDRMVLVLVLPGGQNTELMGVFIFFRQVLSWLPPLVFTVMNEHGISQRFGIGSLNIFFSCSLFAYWRLVANMRFAVAEMNAEEPCGIKQASRTGLSREVTKNDETASVLLQNVSPDIP